MIVGLVRPNSGEVHFEGKDVTDYPMFRRARMGMGYLPQEESIFRKLNRRAKHPGDPRDAAAQPQAADASAAGNCSRNLASNMSPSSSH
jgi:ABC-type iron transport system FetAB ATPase subunit